MLLSVDAKPPRSINRLFQLRFLILAAAIWHICVATTVYEIGRYQVAPNQIQLTGLGRFASDGMIYQEEFGTLTSIFKSQGVRAWLTAPTQLHVRIYSI